MKKVITISILIIVILTLFFTKMNYKKFNLGNNINNTSADKIKKYILDISSYETNATVTINSNKTINTYTILEQYIKQDNIQRIKVLEPSNIEGLEIVYDGANLKIENTKININKIYNNYPYIAENDISLNSFINQYYSSDDTKMEDRENEIVLELKIKNGNKYHYYKKLYINKNDKKPYKLEVLDITQKTIINILYNEIKINNLQKDDILAFKTEIINNDI